MKYFLAGLGLADLGGEGAALAAGAVADATAALEVAAHAGRAQRDVLEDLARALGGPVFVDVNPKAAGAAAAIDASRAFAAPGGPVVVRVPFDDEGRAALRAGATAGLTMAAVGCATPMQALEAAEAGAAWTSPAVGVPPRGAALDELLQVLRKTVALLKSADSTARVLVGPVLDASTLIDVAFAGAHAASAPAALLRQIAPRSTGGG
jgi:transaldolase